jgi:DNA-binding HxlR family transcriptional regulator
MAARQEGTFLAVTNNVEPVQTCLPEDRAAFVRVLDRIGDKWTILIIAELFEGPRRYNELQRRVGEISQRMLTLSLKALVDDGLVSRIPYETIPPRVDYELTPLGFSLRDALRPLWEWALVHMKDGAASGTA